MKIKPLIQLREMVAAALSSMTNLSKSFRTFIIETMELFLTSSGRMNFTQMARCGRSCESRFRQNFKKSFDWLSFNRHFLSPMMGHRIAIGIDPCFIPKAGKKTPGVHSYDIDPHSYDVDPLEEGRAFKEQSLFACKQAAA